MYDRSPRSFRAPTITQRGARATVKWYNPTKGFGFVTMEDGSADAFLHASTVQSAGHDALPEGASIVCDLSQGPKGPQVAMIHSVDTSTAASSPGDRPQHRAPRSDFGRGAPRQDRGGQDRGGQDRGGQDRGGQDRGGQDRGGWGSHDDSGPEAGAVVDGTVKWFNAEKGFGFVAPDSGGKDIFVHRSALERSGLDSLADGEAVRLTIRQGQKGPEAERVQVL